MKVSNVDIYALEKSAIRAGYPMRTTFKDFSDLTEEDYEKALKRAVKLGPTPKGSGHDNFLKGVIVQWDMSAPQHFWLQFERYHYQDTISSQSSMHKIHEFDVEMIRKMTSPYVDERMRQILIELIDRYNETGDKEDYYRVVCSIPQGLELTRGLTANYLQLKGMYLQRRKHKMWTWQQFCDWCETLPYFKEWCLKQRKL